MKKKFTALQSINLNEAIRIKQIKLVEGIPEKILENLSKESYDPAVYEYRNFPKSYPYRVYFVRKDKMLIILRIVHHGEIKNKLAEQLSVSLKKNIFTRNSK